MFPNAHHTKCWTTVPLSSGCRVLDGLMADAKNASREQLADFRQRPDGLDVPFCIPRGVDRVCARLPGTMADRPGIHP